MATVTLHSKLIDLQGQAIPVAESEKLIAQIRSILQMRNSGRISSEEAGTQIRQLAWKISEDLRLNELDLSAGSDESLMENLPSILA